MNANLEDYLLDTWIKFFRNTNKNINIPSSLDNNLHDILDALKNSQILLEKQMLPNKNIENKKDYLSLILHLNDAISKEEYNLFHYFQNNSKLFKKNFDKIQPFFMRGIIHYFNLLEQAFIAICEKSEFSKELEILDDRYTNTFLQLYLIFKDLSRQSQPFDEIINFKYPVSRIRDSNNDFTSENEIDLILRKFDSSAFLQIVQFTPDINSFLLAENYFFLLMKNIDNLDYNEFMNINAFCNSMICHYIKDFMPHLQSSDQNEIIDGFIELIGNLKIGKKEEKIISLPKIKNIENGNNLCLYDFKYKSIDTIFKTVIQIFQNIQACKDHLIDCDFYQSLLHYSIWLFSNSNFIQIYIKKDFDLQNSNDKNHFVKKISSLDELFQFKNMKKSDVDFSNENSDIEKKCQYSNIPIEVKNVNNTINLLIQMLDNDKLIDKLLNDLIDFVNSLSKNNSDDFSNKIKEKFNILTPENDNEFFDKNSLIITSIFIFCEIVRNSSEEQLSKIFTSFDSLNFLFNDILFERIRDENSNHFSEIFINVNSKYLKFVRNSLYMTLLKISKIFLPQINDTFSKLIIGSKLSICDEIISFLIQLIIDNENSFSRFNTDLYTVSLISYISQLNGMTCEVKRFYMLMSKLLKYKEICNNFFENKFFCNFIFDKLFDNEYSRLSIPLLTSLNQVETEKAVKNVTKYILVNSIKYLIDSMNKKESTKNIERINLSFYQIIELFHYHFYFHHKCIEIAIEKTKLLNYIDQCLNVINSSEQFFSIMHLIYSLQYYSDTEQIVKESVNDNENLTLIYQKEYPIFSKLEINSNIKKILGILVFGYHFKHIFELSEKKNKKIVPIKSIEPLWMIHNVLKYNLELHIFYFEYIDFVIDNLFYNQILLSNSKFFKNCLDFICNDKSNDAFYSKIFKKIVSHVLTWNFPSKLFLPSFSFDKNNFLNIIKGCVNHDSFNFPSNFAYLSVFNDNESGIKFGPFEKISYSFSLSFSFRYESIAFNEYEDNFEYIIFNDKENKFSIRISNKKTFQFYSKNSIISSGEVNNEFIVNEKEWHRIVISIPSYSKVTVAVDGKIVFKLNNKSLYGLLNSNLSFCIGQIFDGLISDVQILNPKNYTDSEIIYLSTFGIADENKMQSSIYSFRPYVNDRGLCLFYDSKYQKYQYYYKGDIILEKYSLFEQLKENDLIFCIFSNLNDSKILKKSLKILLRFLSIESKSNFHNIENLIFPDDDSFIRFVFLLNRQINLFNDDVFGLCCKLLKKISNINKKRIFVSEFLFNLNIWKTNFISIYNQLIMNILPNIINQADLNSNTISSVSVFSILNAIEIEESELKKSLLFEVLFSFLHKYLLLINNQNSQQKIESTDSKSGEYILNKIHDFLNDSYCIEPKKLNLSIFDENLNNKEQMNRILTEILIYLKKGNENIVICFILRLFNLIPTQSETIKILEMMNTSCKNLIFKRFLEIISTSSNEKLCEIELSSFYKLISYVTQNINYENFIDILFGVLISSFQTIERIDFNTEFEIFELISNILIENQNESLKIFYLFWSLIILTKSIEKSETDQDNVVNEIIQNFLKFKSKEFLSSFIWLFYLLFIHSNQFKKWKLFNDKLINSIILSLKSSVNQPKEMNNFVQIFVDLIITISLISDENQKIENKLNENEVNLLNLINLIRSDESFILFNSFSLDKIKTGMNSYKKEISEFFAVFEKSGFIVYDCNLINFVTLLIYFNSNDESETNNYIHVFVNILEKMDLEEDLHFEYIAKLFKELSVPKKLISEMKKSFHYFTFVSEEKQNEGETIAVVEEEEELISEMHSESENEENNKKSKENENDDDDNKLKKDEKNESSIKEKENENNNKDDSKKADKIVTENNNNNDNENSDDSSDSLIKNLILQILSNLLCNVLAVSRFYVDFDSNKASNAIDNSLRILCNMEKCKFYLKSFQLHAMNQNQENLEQNEVESNNKFIVFNSNYVPLLLTNKNPFIDVVEIENDFINYNTKSYTYSSVSIEKVLLHFQGTTKKCHLFYEISRPNSFIIGGIEFQNQNVNFIVKHSNSSIEFFLNNGFQFIVEFSSFSSKEEESKTNENRPIIYNLIDSFNELSPNLITKKISELSLDLIEIILLLNFLNGKSFNLLQNLPIIKDVPATQFILENKQQENEIYNDEAIENWCKEFFKIHDFDEPINFDSAQENTNNKVTGTNRCIGILTSPVIFFSVCNKKVFCVDSENTLKAASIILPPRVNRATIQIFNSNDLFKVINNNFKISRNHNKLNTLKNSLDPHCIAFDVIKNNFLNTSETIKHANVFFISFSFDEFSGIFVCMVKMSELSFLKAFNLEDSVSLIIGSDNCFVFITKNSNKVHLIKLNSNSNELNSIVHSYFVSHNSDIATISVTQNFIVSIDLEKKVCLTLTDSLQTVATFSIESIPKVTCITNSPSFRILAMFANYKEEEVKIASIDFNGKTIWEFKRNSDDKSKITNMVALKDKTNMHSNVFIALVINNNMIECRRLNEKQLIKSKKVENNQKLNIENDDFGVLLNSISVESISLIKYDVEINYVGYFDSKNNLNGLFFDYSEKK